MAKRTTSPAGLALIKRFETFSPVIYLCPAGKPTIGYGHVVTPADRQAGRFTAALTEAQAEDLLAADLAPVELYLNALGSIDFTQGRFDACASFCFNLGVGAFDRSTLRLQLVARRYVLAAAEFGKWVNARDPQSGKLVKLNGLVKRRFAERDLFMAGA